MQKSKSEAVMQSEAKTQATKAPINIYDPVVGYTGFSRMVEAGNVHKKGYQIARKEGNFLTERNKKRKMMRESGRGSQLTEISRKNKEYSIFGI
jgi:hypothetical protein